MQHTQTSKVIYISYDGLTDSLGQSQVLPYIEGLSDQYDFFVVSCEKRNAYLKGESTIRKRIASTNIKWFPVTYHKNPPILSTIYDLYSVSKVVEQIIKENTISIIHCRSYISALIGLKNKKKYNIPFIFDMRGFWADERVDGNLWNLSNPLYLGVFKFFKRKEQEFLKHADAVVSLTEKGKEVILQWNSQIENKIYVIPCSADFNLFSIQDAGTKKRARTKLELQENELVITYLGSIGTWYMLDEMLLFFKECLQVYPNAKFLFITSESETYLKNKAELLEVNPSSIRVIKAERSDVPFFLSAANIGLSFIKPCFSKLSSSPTKIGEMLAMGIPIICNSGIGDVKEIIKDVKGGYAFDITQPHLIKEAIKKIPSLLSEDEMGIRERSNKIFNLKSAVLSYKKIYSSILN